MSLLDALIAAKLGGNGKGGGGSESTIAWKPSVSDEGIISWSRTSSTTKPANQNIKGADGIDGHDGADGFSPIVATTTIQGGTRVTITDSAGDHEFDVMNGSGGGNADFALDTTNDFATISNQNHGMSFQFDDTNGVNMVVSDPGIYQKTRILATKDYVDSKDGGTIDVVPGDDKFTVNDPDGINSASLQVGGAGILMDISGSQVAELTSKTYVDNVASSAFIIDTANPCSYNELQNAINTPKVILIKHEGVVYPFVEKWESDESTKRYVNIASIQRQGVDKGAMYFFFEAPLDNFDSPMTYSSSFTQPTGKPYADNIAGNLSNLTTTEKTNLVGAVNELKSSVDALGEPFRVKQWGASNLNVTIVPCTSDAANTDLAKMVFTITGQEATDYQIVGMVAYEIFDAASGGNRINCWPVCQFTGQGQTELSVRFMCGGTTNKVAKRINAWVLLRHR